MGYDLHISRRRQWADAGNDIGADEWSALVARDPELRPAPELSAHVAVWSGPSTLEQPWLEWASGAIHTKNPDEALIAKMVSIAEQLRANVQGDDGERYERGGRVVKSAGPTWTQRLAGVFAKPPEPEPIEPVVLPFGVGDRVRDTWGHEYTIEAIDRAANHGLGAIRLRRADGTTMAHAVVAHGLERVG